MSAFWEWLQTTRGELLTAGAAGAAVSAIMDWENPIKATRAFLVGTVTAYFLGPVGVPVFEWVFGKVSIPVEQSTSVGGFVMGVGGIVIVEIIMKTLRIRKERLGDKDHAEGT